MYKYLRYFILLAVFPACLSFADVLKIRADAPQEYIVKKGDTLWDISALYLNTPWKWPQLWGMNPQIENPHLIYPGDLLALIYNEKGEPRLVVKSEASEHKTVIKLSPNKRIKHKRYEAIATLPLNVITPYLNYERTLFENEYMNSPLVIGGDTNTKNKIEGDVIYASGELEDGHLYGVYRKTRAYKTGGFFSTEYAQEMTLTGTARVVDVENPELDYPAKLKVLSNRSEVRAGDRLISLLTDQSLPATFTLSLPEQDISARILTSSSGHSQFSKLEVVVIDAGSKQGLKAGHVLGIFRQGPDILMDDEAPQYVEDAGRFSKLFATLNPFSDYQMPYEAIGSMVVFKTYNDLSYALITDTQRALKLGDKVMLPE
ncbi:LysM peptidoglycan-binding domain-containing protein [Catenovulum sediminis]|uniref:LysM domain-containing protein n=1 Tax=Catenovulum sediminis TaxID=1740262 RepID=A0ABV1REM6_9ALTE|nr:LysM domain-containing protein [Catenovulum sediminis]